MPWEDFKEKMLTDHEEKLLSYNGELLIFQLPKEKSSEDNSSKVTKLHVRRMIFNSATKLFIEKSAGTFSCEKGTEMIHCSCASDYRTGILLPCILMKKQKKKSIKFTLLLLHHSNNFELVLHFKLDYELNEPIKLFAGPTVLWSYAKNIFHISPPTSTVLCAPIQDLSIKWVGEIKGEGTVLLGTRSASLSEGDEGQNLSDVLIWGSESVAYVMEKQKLLPGTSFLPHAYSSVVSCMHVYRAETVRSKFRTSVVVVTSKNQLIFFQDGLPQNVVQLPYEKPYSIQTASVDGNNQLVVVSFASGDVCAIWKDSLQVASSWGGVKSTLVDDFAGIGTEQILVFLKTDSISEATNTFQITDFGKVNHVSNVSYEDKSDSGEELQENRILTIKALEARLQAGFASVQELQKHLWLKKKLLIESCGALIDIVRGQEHSFSSAEKDGLVSLWDERDKPFNNKEATAPSKIQEQYVEELWYRVVDDILIIGVQLVESFELLLSNVSLSLIMDQKCPLLSPTKCQSNVITLKKAVLAESAYHWEVEPLPKRAKLDCHNGKENSRGPSQIIKTDKTKAFTAITPLSPFLAFHRVHCKVLLHAKKNDDINKNRQESQNMTIMCGNIVLSLPEITTGKYSIDFKDGKYAGSTKDIVALCAVLHKWTFQIISPDYTLMPVNKWLQEKMECVPIKQYPEFVFCHKSGCLNGTLLKWNLQTPFEGNFTVFCRNQSVLFQWLHTIFGLLSPSCKIKLLKLGRKKAFAEQLALTLENEVVTLQHSLSSALRQTANLWPLNSEESKETDSIPAVQQFRDAFKKDQAQIMLGMKRTVGGDLYREIVLTVAEAQVNSDLISWQCSSIF